MKLPKELQKGKNKRKRYKNPDDRDLTMTLIPNLKKLDREMKKSLYRRNLANIFSLGIGTSETKQLYSIQIGISFLNGIKILEYFIGFGFHELLFKDIIIFFEEINDEKNKTNPAKNLINLLFDLKKICFSLKISKQNQKEEKIILAITGNNIHIFKKTEINKISDSLKSSLIEFERKNHEFGKKSFRILSWRLPSWEEIFYGNKN